MSKPILHKTTLEKAIVATVAYFDIFEYPVTLLEMYNFIYADTRGLGEVSLYDISKALDESEMLHEKISSGEGFFYLTNRESLVTTRLQRYSISDSKFTIAKRAVSILKSIPFIEMIGVCNTVGLNNASEKSDIDLLIITRPHTIWVTRLLVMLLTQIMGLRIHNSIHTDKLCLSFFVDTKSLDFSQLRSRERDTHFAFWLAGIMPIFGAQRFAEYIQENLWVKDMLPNMPLRRASLRRRVSDERFGVSKILEPLSSLNGVARWIQMALFSNKKKELARQENSNVIISDSILKFHENDRREENNNTFNLQLQSVGISFDENN